MKTSSTEPELREDERGAPSGRHSGLFFYFFFVCAAIAIAQFAIPTYIIRPFRYQSPRGLLLAMDLRQHAPLGTLLAGILCLIFLLASWKNASRGQKVLLLATMLLVSFSAVMARMNYFEWMFHPFRGPQFTALAESKLAAEEMVMAVRLHGDARAYPISQMAYHHILNDVAGGIPIAVTY